MLRGKKYQDSAKLIEKPIPCMTPTRPWSWCEKTATAKFDETVELHVKLGVDGRHADQQVRGAIVLPNGTGKSVRVLVFAKGEQGRRCTVPPAPTMWAKWIWWKRSRRKTGSTSTWSSPRPT